MSETAPKNSTFGDTYYQIHCRKGISLRVNQNPVMRVNPLRMFSSLACMAETLISTYGVTAASKRPIRTKRSRQFVPQKDNKNSNGLHLTPTTISLARILGNQWVKTRHTGTGIASTLSHDDEHDPPEEDTDRYNLLSGISANEPATRILTKEVARINH